MVVPIWLNNPGPSDGWITPIVIIIYISMIIIMLYYNGGAH